MSKEEVVDISAVRIVLVAPAGPLNVGSVARVMKNFGLSQLILVNPQCEALGAEALQMAVHAKDVLQAARQVGTIPEALEGCCLAIATTARQRDFNAPLELPEAALPALIQQAKPERNTALIFGPEDRGLSNAELAYAQRFIKIPTDAAYSALNLAQAVAVCSYELSKTLRASPLSATQTEFPTETSSADLKPRALPSEGPTGKGPAQISQIAQINELEGYYQHLERLLLKVEYLYSHTAASRMRKFRQLLNRAQPTSQEVAMLRGILRQCEWALSNPGNSPSAGTPKDSSTANQTDSNQD